MNTLAIIGYTAGVVGAVLTLMSKVKTDNLSDLKERVSILEKELVYRKEELEKERKDVHRQNVAKRKAIAKLKGKEGKNNKLHSK